MPKDCLPSPKKHETAHFQVRFSHNMLGRVDHPRPTGPKMCGSPVLPLALSSPGSLELCAKSVTRTRMPAETMPTDVQDANPWTADQTKAVNDKVADAKGEPAADAKGNAEGGTERAEVAAPAATADNADGAASPPPPPTPPPPTARSARVKPTTVLRLRGLPWQATKIDIEEFFAQSDAKLEGGVHIALNFGAAPTASLRHLRLDRRREARHVAQPRLHRHPLHRALRVERGAASGPRRHRRQGGRGPRCAVLAHHRRPGLVKWSAQGYEGVVRMRGLPYSAQAEDVIEFFAGLNVSEEGIHMIVLPDGRPSGEAYVELAEPNDVAAAMKRHKNKIDSRYIELFQARTELADCPSACGASPSTAPAAACTGSAAPTPRRSER